MGGPFKSMEIKFFNLNHIIMALITLPPEEDKTALALAVKQTRTATAIRARCNALIANCRIVKRDVAKIISTNEYGLTPTEAQNSLNAADKIALAAFNTALQTFLTAVGG